MSTRCFEADLFCAVPPDFDRRDGFFHVRQKVGDVEVHLIYPPAVLIRALGKCSEALAAWDEENRASGDVIPFPVSQLANSFHVKRP